MDARDRHLRLLTETIEAVNSTLDLEEVLSLVATNVADALQAEAVDKAASLGIPLRSPDVKVIPLPGGGFRVDVIYLVRVDLGFYAVDLHFHPAAEK